MRRFSLSSGVLTLTYILGLVGCNQMQLPPAEAVSDNASRPVPKELSFKEAYEEWYQERAYPNETIDWKAWPKAMAHRDAMPEGVILGGGSTGYWAYVGPTNVPPPYRTYYGQGTIIGRVNDVAFDPNQTGVLYIASATGGIWKTTNNGQTWTPLSDNWTSLATNAVVVHPTNSNIVFAGTGDFNGSYPYSFGLMKSEDGGQTWRNIGRPQFGATAIRRIMIDPDNPNRMMIAAGKGEAYWSTLWRSTDGGETWSAPMSQTAAWTDIEVSAPYDNGGRWYYASGLDYGGQVWRSGDRGQTWTKLNPPLNSNFQNGLEIAASKVHRATVYLLAGTPRKVYKSTDAGATWTDITAGFPNGNNNYNWSQAWYDWYIETSYRIVDGQPVDVVYVGLIDVVQSRDGGATWQSVGLTYTNGALTHNDQHAGRPNPNNPDQFLCGNDGGVYMLNYNSANNTWSFDTSMNRFLGITQFYKGDFHPTDLNRMIGGTQDNATPASTGDLQNWRCVGGGDGGFCAINQNTPNTQYATSQNLGVYRTTNNWSSSTGISPSTGSDRKAFIAPIVLRPDNPNFLFAGTNYLWRYSQSANSWTGRLGGQELSVSGTVRSIAVAPTHGDTIYTGSNNGELWMTRDGGNTWKQINSGSPGLPNRFIRDILVHPQNPTKIYVALSGTGTAHVWRCENTDAQTRVWISMDGSGQTALPDIPAQSIALNPLGPDKLFYVANDLGVFYTSNGGANWQNITAPLGLPNVQVNDLKFKVGSDSLYAVTWGRGIWRLPVLTWALPTDFSVTRGTLVSGGLPSLYFNDNDRLILQSAYPFAPANAHAEVEIHATLPNPNPPVLRLRIVTNVNVSNLSQRVEMFNVNTQTWETVDQRAATTSDASITLDITQNPTRFVRASDGLVRARIGYRESAPTAFYPWQARINETVWRTF